MEPSQVAVEVSGGDAPEVSEEILEPAVATVHRLNVQGATHPFPGRRVERLVAGPGPTVSVVQDLDDGEAGFGSFWGEMNSNVHKALGCLGAVTNGSVRDLDLLADGFQVLAGVVAPSHGFIHLVDYGGAVSVAGRLDTLEPGVGEPVQLVIWFRHM